MQKLLNVTFFSLALITLNIDTCNADPISKFYQSKYLIEKNCKEQFPNMISDLFARNECINEQMELMNKERDLAQEVEDSRKREENARECIASDLDRMEKIYKDIFHAIKFEFDKYANDLNSEILEPKTIEKSVKTVWEKAVFETAISKDNIREKVLILSISTKCNSKFQFLINIRLDKDGYVKWYKAWIENPPKGYKDTVIINNDYISYQDLIISANKEKEANRKRVEAENDIINKKKLEEDEELRKIASPNNPGYLIDLKNNCRVWDPHPKEAEKVFWDGICSNGYAEGKGKVIWEWVEDGKLNTQINEGNFIKGKNTGDGFRQNIYQDGSIEKYTVINGKPEGEYTKFLNGTYVTKVNYVNGMREGFGKVIYNNGDTYEGYFKNNKRHGDGTYNYKNGGLYIGQFKENLKSGEGKFYYSHGQINYVGQYDNDVPDGKGKLYSKDNIIIYDGNFKNGLYDGFGILYRSSRQRYEGYFKNGFANGKGIYFMKEGESYRIKAKNDCLWNENSITYFFTFSTSESKCKIDGFPY